ncbi:hypothetical protein [Homoserinibacter gongjuensis]|nr:hypothetical protein [Homoserinibacter gongjuensis]
MAAAIPIGYAFWISLQKAPTLVNPQAGFGGSSRSSPPSPTIGSSAPS